MDEGLLPSAVNLISYVVASYLIGSLTFALWIGKLVRGIDLRQHGSGNLGATNVLRMLGPLWGIITLLLDVGKGLAVVALLPGLLAIGSVSAGSPWIVIGAVGAVLGHMFTPFASFRGGKGVATSLGVFIALAPLAALSGVIGFVITVYICRWVSLGSMVLSILFPLVTCFSGPPAPLRYYVVVLGLILAVLVAVRHRANWSRIAAGKEARFQWKQS